MDSVPTAFAPSLDRLRSEAGGADAMRLPCAFASAFTLALAFAPFPIPSLVPFAGTFALAFAFDPDTATPKHVSESYLLSRPV